MQQPLLMKSFLEDSHYIYDQWKEVTIGKFHTKLLDQGSGPILFQTPIARYLEPFWVPILKHFEQQWGRKTQAGSRYLAMGV